MATHESPRRHLILLIALLLIIVLSPFVVTLRHGVTILNIVGAAVLLSATYAVSERRHFLAIAVILSATSIITTGLLVAFPSYWLVLVSHGSLVVLIGFFAFTILGYVVRSGKITSDKIYGAICVYLLFGYAWTFAYALLDELQPGSFAASNEIGRSDYVARVMQLRYFSFMTLTTVGYGDVVPLSPVARTMAMLEAVMGQFYLVALIGRLVGVHIVHTTSSRSRDEG
jgi:voltage-gated potassium channel